jgi:hypothetical protein
MPAACVRSMNGTLARFDNRARDWHYESCRVLVPTTTALEGPVPDERREEEWGPV